MAYLAADVLKIRADVVDDNLRHAFPEMSSDERRVLARRMWEHLFLMGIEVVQAPRKIHDTNWRDYVRLVDADEIIRACFDDRPMVIISGHYGNFELSGYVLALLGFPSFTVARPLDNPYLDRFINDFRGRTGQYILSKKGSSQRDRAGHGLRRHVGAAGRSVRGPQGMLGRILRTAGLQPQGHGAVLAGQRQCTGLVLPMRGAKAKPLHQVMGADGMLDPLTMPADMRTVPAVTQWYTERLEHTIRQAPEQYWWLHRRWREARPRKNTASGSLKRPAASMLPKRSTCRSGPASPELDECPPGRPSSAWRPSSVIALFNVEGTILCIGRRLPAPGRPAGPRRLCGAVVTCPWHGWQFDVRTGQHQFNPRIVQPRFEVRVEGDWILVDLG